MQSVPGQKIVQLNLINYALC